MKCLFAGFRKVLELAAFWPVGRGPFAIASAKEKLKTERQQTRKETEDGGPTPDGSTGAEAGRWNDETPAPIERRLYNKPTPRVVAPATYLLTTINPRQRQRDDDLRSLRARTARRLLQRGTERSKTELKKMRGVRGR